LRRIPLSWKKKFNAKKETVQGEDYLGIKIFRFYMRCITCAAEFTIKTDPQNSDYVAELNCSRNFEQWRENDKQIAEVKKQREVEEEGDAMKALENRTLDSKVEMDILEALDEIKQMNARNSKIDTEELFKHQQEISDAKEKRLDHEDEEDLNNTVFKNSTKYVRKIEDVEKEESQLAAKKPKTTISFLPSEAGANPIQQPVKVMPKIIPSVKVIPKTKLSTTTVVPPPKQKPAIQSSAFSLVSYGDDDEE